MNRLRAGTLLHDRTLLRGRAILRGRTLLRGRAIPLLLAVSGWVVLAVTAAGGPEPVRTFAVFAFALVAPGVAVVRLLPLRDPLERTVLAVALGLSLATITAEGSAIAHILAPTLTLAVLATVCSAGALIELTRRR